MLYFDLEYICAQFLSLSLYRIYYRYINEIAIPEIKLAAAKSAYQKWWIFLLLNGRNGWYFYHRARIIHNAYGEILRNKKKGTGYKYTEMQIEQSRIKDILNFKKILSLPPFSFFLSSIFDSTNKNFNSFAHLVVKVITNDGSFYIKIYRIGLSKALSQR